MKTDLITKGDAVKAILDWMDLHKREVIHKQDIAEIIMQLPSAEKHGHWTYKNGAIVSPWYSSYECSECGCLSGYFKYCPECGSRNRGDEE